MRLALRDERGQSAVEFALVLPLFITLLVALIYVGIAYNGWIDETHLASTAARYVAVGNEKPEGLSLEEWIHKQGDSTFVRKATTEICKPGAAGTLAVGEPVEVRLTFMYKWAPFFDLEHKAVSKAVMRVEVVPSPARSYPKCTT